MLVALIVQQAPYMHGGAVAEHVSDGAMRDQSFGHRLSPVRASAAL
jgi:hypothetical protein